MPNSRAKKTHDCEWGPRTVDSYVQHAVGVTWLSASLTSITPPFPKAHKWSRADNESQACLVKERWVQRTGKMVKWF